MKSHLIAVSKSGVCLYGGLLWRMLEGYPSRSAIRQGSQEGAKYGVMLQTAQFAEAHAKKTKQDLKLKKNPKAKAKWQAGFFVPGIEDQDVRLDKKAHSAALAFLIAAAGQQQSPVSVLAVELPSVSREAAGVSGKPFYYVVISDKNSVSLDMVYPTIEGARDAVANYLKDVSSSYQIVTNRGDIFASAQVLATDAILQALFDATHHNKQKTQIKKLPFDLVGVLIPLVSALLLAMAWSIYKDWREQRQQLEQQAQSLASDPLPGYLAALAKGKRNAGVNPASMEQALAKVMSIPTRIPPDGTRWILNSVVCAQETGCKTLWQRKLGTYNELHEFLPGFKLVPGSDGANLDVAQMVFAQTFSPATLSDTLLPKADEFFYGSSGALLQEWKTAGLIVQLQPTQLWPANPGLTKRAFPQKVNAGGIEISNIALPQLAEVLTKAPSNVYWKEFSIAVSAANTASNVDPMNLATARVKGVFYVKD